jgi:hypothetical protein
MNENGNLPLPGIVIDNFGTLDAFRGTYLPTEVTALVPAFQFLVTNLFARVSIAVFKARMVTSIVTTLPRTRFLSVYTKVMHKRAIMSG